MYSATAFNHAYADTGLFCIHASAPPTHIRGVTEVLCRELVAMSTVPGAQELRVIINNINNYSEDIYSMEINFK